MAITEKPLYSASSARHARGRRRYLRSYPVAARRPDQHGSPGAIKGRFWLGWVAILSVPSLVFLLLYVFYVPGDLPKFLDVGMTAALAVSGLFGVSTAFAAFVVAIIATLRAGITRKTRIALWTLVVLSLACWLYIWISFSALVQVPPLIPLKM